MALLDTKYGETHSTTRSIFLSFIISVIEPDIITSSFNSDSNFLARALSIIEN